MSKGMYLDRESCAQALGITPSELDRYLCEFTLETSQDEAGQPCFLPEQVDILRQIIQLREQGSGLRTIMKAIGQGTDLSDFPNSLEEWRSRRDLESLTRHTSPVPSNDDLIDRYAKIHYLMGELSARNTWLEREYYRLQHLEWQSDEINRRLNRQRELEFENEKLKLDIRNRDEMIDLLWRQLNDQQKSKWWRFWK